MLATSADRSFSLKLQLLELRRLGGFQIPYCTTFFPRPHGLTIGRFYWAFEVSFPEIISLVIIKDSWLSLTTIISLDHPAEAEGNGFWSDSFDPGGFP
jgi:hypothetical protein